jgi:PAS domain S-box-containing protein
VGVVQLTEGTLLGFIDRVPDALIAIDENGLIILVNAQAELLFGYRRDQIVGMHVDRLVPIADIKYRPSATGVEMFGRQQDGTRFPASISMLTRATTDGLITTATIRDATERIEIDAERMRLKAEAEQDRLAAEERRITAEGEKEVAERVRLEAEARRITAEGEKEVAERVRLVAEVDRVTAEGEKEVAELARLAAEERRITAEGEKKEAERVRLEAEADRVTAEGEKKEAERVRLEAEADRVTAEGEKKEAERVRLEAEVDRVTAEDEKTVAEGARLEAVADRQRLEAQLHQSQRMESLGQLAGGVAHDFNNLLAVILNYASFVAEELSVAAESPEGAHWEAPLKDVRQIQLAAERASLLTHQLLSFARREVVQARPLSLNGAITRMEQILRRTIGEQVELVIELGGTLPMVLADPGQIEQIVLNLAINARDAMPSGGTLTIDTSAREVTEAESPISGVPAGDYVCFRVGDNGVGMAEDVRDRAFEPFFTTKPRGEGSGLGLATVYGIVSQSGGFTKIYSDEGIGTSITILLPAAKQDVLKEELEERAHHLKTLVGSETILVVDDEDALREVTRRILTRNGYTVLVASRGAEAVDIAATHGGKIDLVLTDVIMPVMQGPTVANEVRKLRPGIRVIYMSGHAQPVLEAEAVLGTDFLLLEKPFDQTILLENLRKVLDRAE